MWTVRVSPHKWIAASSRLLQCFVAVWPKHSIENMVSCTNPDIECSNLLQNIDSILDWRGERSELESFQRSRPKDTRCQYTLVGLAKSSDRRAQRVFRLWYNNFLTIPRFQQRNKQTALWTVRVSPYYSGSDTTSFLTIPRFQQQNDTMYLRNIKRFSILYSLI